MTRGNFVKILMSCYDRHRLVLSGSEMRPEVQMLLTPALLSHKDTAQCTLEPIRGIFGLSLKYDIRHL